MILISFNGFSQDIIYKKDGSEISAKIIEIEENSIKYKLFDQLEGPLRNVAKSEIFLIIYQDGTREKFETASQNQTISQPIPVQETPKPPQNIQYYDKNQDINYVKAKLEKAYKTQKIGKSLIGIGTICAIGGFISLAASGGSTNTAVWFSAAVVTGIVGPIILISGNNAAEHWESKKRELSISILPFYSCNPNLLNKSNTNFGVGINLNF